MIWLWHWFTAEQFTRLDEVVFGFLMMIIGLYLEDWIDRIRGRKHQ